MMQTAAENEPRVHRNGYDLSKRRLAQIVLDRDAINTGFSRGNPHHAEQFFACETQRFLTGGNDAKLALFGVGDDVLGWYWQGI